MSVYPKAVGVCSSRHAPASHDALLGRWVTLSPSTCPKPSCFTVFYPLASKSCWSTRLSRAATSHRSLRRECSRVSGCVYWFERPHASRRGRLSTLITGAAAQARGSGGHHVARRRGAPARGTFHDPVRPSRARAPLALRRSRSSTRTSPMSSEATPRSLLHGTPTSPWSDVST